MRRGDLDLRRRITPEQNFERPVRVPGGFARFLEPGLRGFESRFYIP